jgi:hypothetical protein
MRSLAARIFSTRCSFLLRRDSTTPLIRPDAGIPILVRPVQQEDIAPIVRQHPICKRTFRKGLATCYVATTSSGEICYVQWLIDPSQNELIARDFAGLCPPLSHDERLLHSAYTSPGFNAEAIMASAMADICESAAAGGGHWLYIFVAAEDTATLKLCSRLGFRPHQVCTETWRFFRLTQSFEQFAKGTRYSFERDAIGEQNALASRANDGFAASP